MVWKKIRIDFTDTVKCQFCHRTISSGKGIVIQDESGRTAFSGPSCAQNKNGENVLNPDEKIIDITKGCLLQEAVSAVTDKEKTAKLQDNFTSEHDNEVNNYLDENAVKAYLTLRFDKLAHLKSIFKSKKLSDVYKDYETTGKLSSKDENYIKMIMYGERCPLFTYKNLQAVYAAEYWLLSFIEHNPDKDLDFIKDTLKQLRIKLYLTRKQIIGINNWFIHSKGKMVKLKINAFAKNIA